MSESAQRSIDYERKEATRRAWSSCGLTRIEVGLCELLEDLGEVVTVSHASQHEDDNDNENERRYSCLAISQQAAVRWLRDHKGIALDSRNPLKTAIESLESLGVLLVDRRGASNRPHLYVLDWSRHMSLEESQQYDLRDAILRLTRERDQREAAAGQQPDSGGTTARQQRDHSQTAAGPQRDSSAQRVTTRTRVLNTQESKTRDRDVGARAPACEDGVEVDVAVAARPWREVTSEQLVESVLKKRLSLLGQLYDEGVAVGWWVDCEDTAIRFLTLCHHCATSDGIRSAMAVLVRMCRAGLDTSRCRHDSEDWANRAWKSSRRSKNDQ